MYHENCESGNCSECRRESDEMDRECMFNRAHTGNSFSDDVEHTEFAEYHIPGENGLSFNPECPGCQEYRKEQG